MKHYINGLAFPFKDYFDRFGDNVLGFGQADRDLALSYVKNFRTVVDIGAHVGISVLNWAKLFEQVHAFEPMADHYECLVENTKQYINVTAHNAAVSNHQGTLKAAYRTLKNSGSFQLVEDQFIETNRKETVIYEVFSTMLDEFELKNVDLIKIDVEGWELEVLKGAVGTIRGNKPVLQIEFTHGGGRPGKSMHTYDVQEYYDMIEELGYKQVAQGGDYIYIPK